MNPPNSPVVWIGKPSWSTYVFIWVFVVIMIIRGIVSLRLGSIEGLLFHLATVLMLVAITVFLRQTTSYYVTRKAVHRSSGIFGRGEKVIPISTIESVNELQGPFDRLWGTGDVLLHIKGGSRERLAGVKDPEVVGRKIRALL